MPNLLGVRPVRRELIYLLVSLGKQYTAEVPRPVRPVRMRVSGCYRIIGEVTGRRPGRGRIHHDIRR